MSDKDILPFALPDIAEEEIQEVIDTLKSGWISSGPKAEIFEKDFKNYVDSKYAFAVTSATAGMHLALEAVGIEYGDYVITTSYTFTATAEVIRYFGAHPLFCDIDEKTLNIDPLKLDALIKNSTDKPIKAIMPVHFGGQACDMKEIMKIAKKNNLPVIEDAAHGLSAEYHGKKIGSIGDITVFSFYATKPITTGEGGMITTNNDKYAKRIKTMRYHGLSKEAWDRKSIKNKFWYYEIIAPGYKYNLSDILASVGLQQLKKCEKFYEKRYSIANRYNKAFSEMNGIEIPYLSDERNRHGFHLYVIKVDETNRDQFIEKMYEKGIACSVHFIPLHIMPYWRDKYQFSENDFPVSFNAYKKVVSLPIYTKMTDADVDRVIEAVKDTVKELSG